MKKEERIELIRKSIRENTYPLEYDYKDVYRKGNCYSYAIGSKCENGSIYEEEYIYNLGCISNQAPATNVKEAERNFLKDMEILGVQARKSSLDEKILDGEWKVILFYEDVFIDSYDFHFARQDKDGNWSHREYINGPVRKLGKNPEGCTDLTFVNYYVLSINK